MEAISDDWHPLINDCMSRCLRGDSHENCKICEALVIQLKHCATASCDSSVCGACGRVVLLISQHYAECGRQLKQPEHCYCSRYLATCPNPATTCSSGVEMVSVDGVRQYLLSVFPSLLDHNAAAAAADDDDDDDDVACDCGDGDDKDFNSSDDDDDDDDDDEDNEVDEQEEEAGDHGVGDDKDIDSDSSDDSLMMPSFSSESSSFQLPAVPESGAFGIANLALCGRGVNSPTTTALPAVGDVTQLVKPVVKRLEAVVVSEAADPRLCVSFEAPAGTGGSHTGVLHSVPVTGASRPLGKVCYGTKSRLQQFANLLHNYADRARENRMQSSRELPGGGVVLYDFRKVSLHSVQSFNSCTHTHSVK